MFETDGEEVMQQWTKYLNVMDGIVQESMCANIRHSLEILKRGLEGDPRSGAITPIFKLNVFLEDNNIAFSPTIASVSDMILGIYPTICHTIRPFPRLIQFLGDPNTKVQSFSHILANDTEARLIQRQISEIVVNCTNRVEKYLKAFEPYRDIWEVDKDWFMQRYERLLPTIKSFDTDIGRYVEVANIIDAQEDIHNVGFCVLDCTKLKETVIMQCRLWQQCLCKLLFRAASKSLIGCYTYMEENLSRFSRPPEGLDAFVRDCHVFRTIAAEVSTKKLTFGEIYDQFECLTKYDTDLGEGMDQKVENLEDEWHNYLQKLKEVDNMLKNVKAKMHKKYSTKADDFKKRVISLIKDFNKKGPDLSDGLTEDVVEDIEDYLVVAENLSTEEQELLTTLEIFEIEAVANISLKNFIKKLNLLIASAQS